MDVLPELIDALKRGSVRVFLVGYAHIDSEWLWGLEEMSRACSSTYRRVLELMERFKNATFTQGAALSYEVIERSEPALFRKILDKVRENRWRITGAPFLEFDTYMPSGESLIRHLLYGHQFFRRFRVNIEPVVFLPDSFGFPSSLPRILRGFGIKFFVTYKLNWNDTNRVRHYIFYWGEEPEEAVLTYILPGNYNDYLNDVKRLLWILYKQFKELKIPAILVVYGRGDHGGGPEDVEIKNVEYWRRKLRPFMKLSHGGMEEFLKYIDEKYGNKLPLVRDELYLEFHRGVYTTGAAVKKLNRINENLIIQVEKLYSLLKAIHEVDYPFNGLRKAWRNILLNQGHDSLPATVTREVYEQIADRGRRTFKSLLEMLKEGLEKLSLRTGYKYTAFNPNAWYVSTYVRTRTNIKGSYQTLRNGLRLYYLEQLPPLGYKAFDSIESEPRDRALIRDKGDQYVLENSYLKVTISKKSGWITGIFDKVNRQEVLKGPITLRVLCDMPTPFRVSAVPASMFDAWEVYYNEGVNRYLFKDLRAHDITVGEKGSLYASVRLRYRYRQAASGTTLIELEAGLYANKPFLELRFRGYWKARHRFLKMMIPLNINSREALFEVPYGVTVRKDACLSRNPVDKAKFEAPGHRWVDVSRETYGVAVMTDSRYGYSWCNGTLGISLLRAATSPDRGFLMKFVSDMKNVQEKFADISMELSSKLQKIGVGLGVWLSFMILDLLKLKELRPVDRGYHASTVWIYPHKGNYVDGGVVKYAAELNTLYMLHVSHGSGAGKNTESFSLLSVEPNNAVEVTAFKPCERGECSIIRLFNHSPRKVKVKLRVGVELSEVYEGDLAENIIKRVEHEDHGLSLELKPYEIKTLLIKFRDSRA